MYKVNVTATLDDQAIHVEEFGRPESLLYAVEGDDPAPVARLAWRYIHSHREQHCVKALHLLLPPALPPWRRSQVERATIWLVRQIMQGHAD